MGHVEILLLADGKAFNERRIFHSIYRRW